MDFSVDESPAVKALGPLFKITEVQLWDDGSSEVLESPYLQESIKFTNGDKDYVKGDNERTNGFHSLNEDSELTKQMNDLGLPLSFCTKETSYGVSGRKKKGTRKSIQQCLVEIDDCMLDSIKASEEESISPDCVLNTSKMLDQSDALRNGTLADIDGLSYLSLERDDSLSSTAWTSTLTNEHGYNGEVSDLGFYDSFDCSSGLGNIILEEAESIPCSNETMATGIGLDYGTSEGSCLINEGAHCDGKEVNGELCPPLLVMAYETDGQSNDINLEMNKDSDEQTNSSMANNYQIANAGEWIAYWDDFHTRTYFYNVESEESTWDPPSGMEHLVYGNIADEVTSIAAGLSVLDNDQMDFQTSEEVLASCDLLSAHSLANELTNDACSSIQQSDGITENWLFTSTDNVSNTKSRNKKKKARKTKSNTKISISSEDLLEVLHEVPPSISKYWCQRYLLFSRFDNGIKMDEEGWFSVTPELLAKHHADRCGHGAIVDLFTGVGGNAIQFAQRSKNVIAIDIDPIKIDYAQQNAAIYGVDGRIDFVKGDSFSLAPKLKANTVFMSPPWGGPAYSKVKKFDINTMLKPRDGQYLFNAGKRIAPKIVMFLPRNVDINQLAELSLSATPPWSLEVERNFLNGRLKGVTAYFSEPSMS